MLSKNIILIGLLSFVKAIPTVDIFASSKSLFSRGPISTDGSCGGTDAITCTGSTFGICCSSFGFCGNTTTHCGTSLGCQPAFGRCASTAISPDGSCGGNTGFYCVGSTLGMSAYFYFYSASPIQKVLTKLSSTCCSSSGFCETAVGFCAQGCRPSAGSCTTGTVPSLTGECGSTNGKFTCAGGPQNGKCCSSSGFW